MDSQKPKLGPESVQRRALVTTADGASTEAFEATDWALTIMVSLIWGSSFLWIAIGLDSLTPSSVAFGRLALGAAALGLLPAARRTVPGPELPKLRRAAK